MHTDPPIQKLLHTVGMLCIGYYEACQRKNRAKKRLSSPIYMGYGARLKSEPRAYDLGYLLRTAGVGVIWRSQAKRLKKKIAAGAAAHTRQAYLYLILCSLFGEWEARELLSAVCCSPSSLELVAGGV
jgi:hypothetical protein